ncbi:uncharacterized protein LOC127148305 [Cucumis melo]|uniref:Uncharacterized protein LOC127148305 n=1 Tax=Cucumis melo TaxID=3656 RepID=A0ABM3KIZ0_CUCME|nr:uncharacterized protein LOC127148305 [Cucumis melo]
MSQQEAEDAADVITGTILICNVPARVLLDPSATHSFVSNMFLTMLNRMLEPLSEELVICTPVGDVLLVGEVLRDCEEKVTFRKPGSTEVVFKDERKIIPTSLISALKAAKLLRKGCTTFLAHVVKVQEEQLKPEDVPVVNEYIDVFPADLSGFSPDKEVEFTFELLPGTTPISQAPYRMAPSELKELKLKEFHALLIRYVDDNLHACEMSPFVATTQSVLSSLLSSFDVPNVIRGPLEEGFSFTLRWKAVLTASWYAHLMAKDNDSVYPIIQRRVS